MPSQMPTPRGALVEQADLDLTRRAIHGAWVSLFIFVVLAASTSYFHEHPRLAFSFSRGARASYAGRNVHEAQHRRLALDLALLVPRRNILKSCRSKVRSIRIARHGLVQSCDQ